MNPNRITLTLFVLLLLLFAIVPITLAQQATGEFESYQYPVIKWKPKSVGGIPGAVAQLTTTYDPKVIASMSYGGCRYNLTLFKVTSAPYLRVELLDRDGFKLEDFSVSSTDFQPIPGTELMEAKSEFHCSEDDYKKVRDYRVGVPGSSEVPSPTMRTYSGGVNNGLFRRF